MEQAAKQPFKQELAIVVEREIPTTPYGGVTNVTVLQNGRKYYVVLAQDLDQSGVPFGPSYVLPYQIGRLLHEEHSDQWPDLVTLRLCADEAKRVRVWSRNPVWGYQHFKQLVLQQMMARKTVVGLFDQPKA
jgi:hypothetical protein